MLTAIIRADRLEESLRPTFKELDAVVDWSSPKWYEQVQQVEIEKQTKTIEAKFSESNHDLGWVDDLKELLLQINLYVFIKKPDNKSVFEKLLPLFSRADEEMQKAQVRPDQKRIVDSYAEFVRDMNRNISINYMNGRESNLCPELRGKMEAYIRKYPDLSPEELLDRISEEGA